MTRKNEERELAKQRLKQQFQNIKTVTLARKPKRWVIEAELGKLEGKLADVLARETEILRIGKGDSELIKELKNRIQKLEFQLDEAKSKRGLDSEQNNQQIAQLQNALSEIKEKIITLTAKHEKRPKRKSKHDILKSKIEMLERKHQKMKTNGKFDDDHLDKLESKINALKNKMTERESAKNELLKHLSPL